MFLALVNRVRILAEQTETRPVPAFAVLPTSPELVVCFYGAHLPT